MVIMGRSTLCLAIALPVLLLAGCPLVSDYPLSDPKAARIDSSLLGSWRIEGQDANDRGSLTLFPFDEHELVGVAREEKTGKLEAFRAFATEVRGERFLNARELGGGSAGWYILNYRLDGQKLLLRPVDDGLFREAKVSSSAEILGLVESGLDDPKLYAAKESGVSVDMVLTRAED
jgi:hypothetical protein